jgi:hypothetical protein
MEICYPAILLFILGILIIIQASRAGLYWKAGPFFASPVFIFAFICYYLCKKGHKKMAWAMPLVALIFTGALLAGV